MRDDPLTPDARALLEAAPDGVMLLDDDERIRFVNAAVCTLAGVSADALTGRRPVDLRNDSDWEMVGPVAESRGTTGRHVFDVSFRHHDGHIVWVQVSLRRLRRPDGRSNGIFASVVDVTRQRGLERALRSETDRLEREVAERSARLQLLEARRVQSERLAALGQLAGGVAHEINNPLAGIKNALLLVRDAVPLDHPDRMYLEMIDKEVDRIGTIVKRLSQVYRPEAGQGSPVDLRRLLGDARQLLAAALLEYDVRLSVELEHAPAALIAPPHQLLDIVVHLLRNAIEASPRATDVTVTITGTPTETTIAIADQGPGISEQVRRFMFDPFFTTKTVERGLSGVGLGLSVSQSLVAALGGRLYVDSHPEGGTICTVVLPRDHVEVAQLNPA